jgi:hypothetical protein
VEHAGTATAQARHPIRLVVTDDLRRNRLTVFFRLLIAIPHLVWLYLWGIVVTIAVVVAWFAALFTGRVPDGLHDFLARYVRYQTHVFAYLLLAADPFPGFAGEEGSYPIDVRIAGPTEQNRLTVFFRIILALPALIFGYILNYLSSAVSFFAWFVCLALARMPEGMESLQLLSIRYHAQTQAYTYLLTERYPSLSAGQQAAPA